MSVINKMLRDLDRQQQHQRSHGPLILQRKSRWSWLPWFIIPLALVAGWLGQAWFTRQATPEQTPIVGEAEVEHSQLSPLTAEDEPLRQQAASAQRTVPEAPVELTPVTPLPAAPLAETGATTAEPAQNPIAEPVQAEQATAPEPEAEEPVAEAQVSAAEAETEWSQEPALSTAAPVKAPSLSIEKVELSLSEQQSLLVQQARKAENAGQLMQALQLWQKAAALLPTEAEPYLQQSRLWQIQGNHAAAEQVLQQAVEQGNQDPNLLMALAGLAVRQQRWQDAVTVLNAAPDFSQHPDFYALKAAALQKTGQHAQAIGLFQQLARLQPQQARWWLGMALSFDALAQREQALLAYRQAENQGISLAADSLNFVRSRIAELE
ncbi:MULTISPECIES: tetratricopeptide repeat protein [Rheinheimera]|uniref:Tetratricopeptide repeat protein n=1 Tax=Rheinheimera marina TaxID=1774958 RepID=A0ABV9JGI1_9GAMM